ncbi:MAG: SpoIVB peptidase S55 domain-containing protein [Lachnospirales bacterium]
MEITDYSSNLGTIVKNNNCGIYGKINNSKDFTSITMPVGYRGEVKKRQKLVYLQILTVRKQRPIKSI